MNGRRSTFELYKTARCYYWLRRHKTSPPKQSKLPRYKYSHVEWLGPGSLEKKIWASLSPQTVTHIMQEFSANRIALGFLCLMRGVLKDAKQSQKNCLPPLCHRVLCKCAADRTHKNHSEAASYMFFSDPSFPCTYSFILSKPSDDLKSILSINPTLPLLWISLKWMDTGNKAWMSKSYVNRDPPAPLRAKTNPKSTLVGFSHGTRNIRVHWANIIQLEVRKLFK